MILFSQAHRPYAALFRPFRLLTMNRTLEPCSTLESSYRLAN